MKKLMAVMMAVLFTLGVTAASFAQTATEAPKTEKAGTKMEEKKAE